MSQAKDTLPRRTILAALAASPLAAAPALAADPDPDAELVRLGREWRRLWDYLDTKEAEALPEKEWNVIFDQRVAIENAIWATPAAGVGGLGVKALIAKRHSPGGGNHADYVLLEDVLRLSGQMVA